MADVHSEIKVNGLPNNITLHLTPTEAATVVEGLDLYTKVPRLSLLSSPAAEDLALAVRRVLVADR